ncbi:TPA: pilin N-terminal domain-containing protein [Enterococcus faecium]
MKKRYISLLVPLFMLTIYMSQPVQASTYDQVTVNVHKQLFTSQPEAKEQDGQLRFSMTGTPEANDSFTVYDATAIYQDAQKKSDFDTKVWIKSFAQMDDKEIQALDLKSVTQIKTNDLGIASVTLPVVQQAAYLFVEETSEQVTEPTAPVMLILPFYEPRTGQELQTVQLYLKNTQSALEIKEPVESLPTTTSPSVSVETETSESPWYTLPNTGSTKTKVSLIGVGILLLATGFIYLQHKKNKQKQ